MKTLRQLQRIAARHDAHYSHVDDVGYEAGSAAIKRAQASGQPFDWDAVFCAASYSPGMRIMRDKAYARYQKAQAQLESHPDYQAWEASQFEYEERNQVMMEITLDLPYEWAEVLS